MLNNLLLLLPLLFFLCSLSNLMFVDQGSEVGHILIGLLEQVGKPFVLLLVNQLPVALFILCLSKTEI